MSKKKKYNPYGLITSALRKLWLQSPMRREAMRRVALTERPTNKDGSLSKRLVILGYVCEGCHEVHTKSGVQVHHKNPVVPNGNMFEMKFNEVVERMFCSSEELVVLCKDCHKKEHT